MLLLPRMKRFFLSATAFTIILPVIIVVSGCNCRKPLFPIPEDNPQNTYLIDSLPGADNATTVFDEEKLAEIVTSIKSGEFGDIHSLIIIHNDELIREEYFRGWNRHMLHWIASAAKSFTSALVGIAIDKGFVNGVDDTLLSFFPEYDDIANFDDRKAAINLKHMLTMTPGFMWDEESVNYFDFCGNWNPENDVGKLFASDDWIEYILSLPMESEPGIEFVYNSGVSHVLSGIVSNTTGQSMENFAKDNLFKALGITKWVWPTDPNGITQGAGGPEGLSLHPVNMAMFGYLFLKNGRLNGEQIISESWIKESTIPQISTHPPTTFYGYQWWIKTDVAINNSEQTYDFFLASGLGGQIICIIPTLDLVVVMTADNYTRYDPGGLGPAFRLLLDFIIPAVGEKD